MESNDRIGPYDVLCGRHKEVFNNVGNRRFRVTVSLSLERYVAASGKKEKTIVVRSIIDLIRKNGGRFLKWDGANWIELSKRQTIVKVGHAIRDALNRSSAALSTAGSSSVANKPSNLTPDPQMPKSDMQESMAKEKSHDGKQRAGSTKKRNEIKSGKTEVDFAECESMATFFVSNTDAHSFVHSNKNETIDPLSAFLEAPDWEMDPGPDKTSEVTHHQSQNPPSSTEQLNPENLELKQKAGGTPGLAGVSRCIASRIFDKESEQAFTSLQTESFPDFSFQAQSQHIDQNPVQNSYSATFRASNTMTYGRIPATFPSKSDNASMRLPIDPLIVKPRSDNEDIGAQLLLGRGTSPPTTNLGNAAGVAQPFVANDKHGRTSVKTNRVNNDLASFEKSAKAPHQGFQPAAPGAYHNIQGLSATSPKYQSSERISSTRFQAIPDFDYNAISRNLGALLPEQPFSSELASECSSTDGERSNST